MSMNEPHGLKTKRRRKPKRSALRIVVAGIAFVALAALVVLFCVWVYGFLKLHGDVVLGVAAAIAGIIMLGVIVEARIEDFRENRRRK